MRQSAESAGGLPIAASGETCFAARAPDGGPIVSRGLPFEKACAHHVRNTFHASHIYVAVSKSIGQTDNFTRLHSELAEEIVAVHYGVGPHTPWEDVLAMALEIKAHQPDLIITLGGGSITDGVKVAAFAAANEALDVEALERLLEKSKAADSNHEDHVGVGIEPCAAPVINVPTTLSGAEFTHIGGATHPLTRHKALFVHPSMRAALVVLDPELSLSTPRRVWLASGMRGVDHCVEAICSCSGLSSDANHHHHHSAASNDSRVSKEEAVRHDLELGLRKLLSSLLVNARHDWGDTAARLQSMLVVTLLPAAMEMGFGASHGIGHQLGPLGVGHGETSCVLLPAVLKYNWAHGGERVRELQGKVLDAFWGEEAVADMLEARGLKKKTADAGDLVDAFVRGLGMPRSLAAVGVGREQFDALAESAVLDWCTEQNPVKLDKQAVLEILDSVA